jgi:hypothetical protein
MHDFVPELAEVQKLLQQEWPDSPEEIRAFVKDEIERSPRMWRLKRNLLHLMAFLADDCTAHDFRGDTAENIKLSPTSFFVKWLANSKNRSVESVRQDLYRRSAKSHRKVQQ